ncbi:alpha-L-arabinofuranosidase C-terminal domain-containing protein [Bifidobacterium longum]|nr:alpha-L-arabinofuranosidase C-terminal domain-containing protein [Bifidobacterium longum]MDB6573327.1 alpha-L-arabinofuranosidase C-terminal domain-containing protein [Bifidobacterium longum]MDB6579484.1 alpha-L-arabinofuranosidase C-terminal domain-containing protein [Bifidobacterium longum]MDB6585206.1 alpha-L-arabinofuranosidase C-terminal domain-containing protein [Bifidobacterium longum]
MTDKLIATLDKAGVRAISTDLWGIFFEDISYSGDGGLNADLVQNGAFEYNRADSAEWSNYSFWRKIVPDGSFAAFCIHDIDPVAVENPHYATVEIEQAPAALDNTGWDGMVFHAGETYDFTAWMRVRSGSAMPVTVSLHGDDGSIISETTITVTASAWTTYQASLTVPESGEEDGKAGASVSTQGTLRLTFGGEGVIDLDFITLEPRTTYHGLKHFRPDLVKALADLKPRFMRFPGGCITHGLGMDNMYHWDRTIGPVEHRPHNFNLWGYHQSFRIGYYEYLCLCETIGAKPLPVLPAGVSCQNTSQGPVPVAQEDMPAYIDEVLHLIEFCNGGTDTEWGAKRAAMGHPEPFGLEYLGIGNEDLIDDVFKNRFQQIFDAVKAAYPDIVVVGTVGPSPSGKDYEEGWKYAREAGLPIVDEHSYQSSSWWFHNLDHYDHTDRKGPKVYLGEYGSWNTQLINGLSEAAFMGRMELNGDVVHMASYAPLFAKNGHTSWNPDLIYFDNENVYRPYSYWVQQMYATTTADTAWPVSLDGPTTLRRDLPNTVSLKIDGGAHADFADFSLETADGTHIDLPDVSYQGNGPVSLPAPEGLTADSYTIRAKVTYYEGMWGVRIASGDVNGKNYNGTSLGRGFSVQVVREGTGYALAGTETSMDAVRPGTTWDVRIEIGNRGEQMRLYIDGALVADGHETPDEPRRTVTVSRDSTAGVTYLRVVNALPESVDVDLAQVLAALNVPDSAKAVVEATVLTGNDPYAGIRGEESPTCPTSHEVNLADGTYTAPAWSFTTLAVRG